MDWNVPVSARDGTVLRVNVFRPDDDGRHPVLLCAHPYGKDDLPVHHPTRRGYRPSPQYHLMRSAPVTHSAWTSWESPDPAYWTARGYVVVNADLRGWGTSDGVPDVLSDQEGRDVHDLVEWAAGQPWSTGRVGMTGVSYLAISQWAGAATRPPHLSAICPWEGFTDFYRDFARPGGILETGFLTVWGTVTKRRSGGSVDLVTQAHARATADEWYESRNRDLEAIDVPALVCGSFSDHNLHSRGSFEGFRRIGSSEKWLYTHRGPKWAVYYGHDALRAQARFFDHFLAGHDTGIQHEPPVRLEIREDRGTIAEVRHVASWPPPGTRWLTLVGRAGDRPATGTLQEPAGDLTGRQDECVTLPARRGTASFTYRFERDTAVVGPMVATVHLSVAGARDFPVLVGIRKFRHGREVPFEGSFGFTGDLVTHGMLLASHRAVDPERSLPYLPFHAHTDPEPLAEGQRVRLRIGLLPSATLFRAGEELRMDVRGRWFHSRDPLHGQFPAGYRTRAAGTATLYLGTTTDCTLEIPILPSV
ncbi:hydrolase [Nakamurella endophytica]|uniref:Hydrolase n=1 Tax=Nakamurella endophytica TaxID=1748367 RepID=A0A917SQ87_9ACTN|nr:hydrolase [Nakamurella endophytica]